jgi:hypothetical protein
MRPPRASGPPRSRRRMELGPDPACSRCPSVTSCDHQSTSARCERRGRWLWELCEIRGPGLVLADPVLDATKKGRGDADGPQRSARLWRGPAGGIGGPRRNQADAPCSHVPRLYASQRMHVLHGMSEGSARAMRAVTEYDRDPGGPWARGTVGRVRPCQGQFGSRAVSLAFPHEGVAAGRSEAAADPAA